MKNKGRKFKITALATIMLGAPAFSNLSAITAEAATTYKREIKVNNVPNFTGFKGYVVRLRKVNDPSYKPIMATSNGNGSLSVKETITVTGTNNYYVEVCYKQAGTGNYEPYCVKTNTVTINESTFKSSKSKFNIKLTKPSKTYSISDVKATLTLK